MPLSRGQYFTKTHAPGAAAQATASQAAAGALLFNHCTGIIASFSAGATGGTGTVNLRDGATGAGTVLASFDMSALLNTSQQFVFGSLDIPGSVNTAMTLEFAAAGAATTLEKVTLIGYVSDQQNSAGPR
jgi:hypothetical protein